MKNILIAGGNGFIGTNLALSLQQKGNHVVIVDNLVSSREKRSFWREHKVQFIQKNIQSLKLSDFERPIHQIYNLASVASPPLFAKYGLEILETHSQGHQVLLELALHFKARILYASSSEVYGEPIEHPQNENSSGRVSLEGPRAYYDESKRFAEVLTRAYQEYRGVSTCTARIFNTYGPEMDLSDGRVISELFRCYLNNLPFQLEGDGHQTRSFCYVADTVSALELLMDSEITEPINIGNDAEISVLELLHAFQSLMKVDLNITKANLPLHSPTRRRPDLFKAKSLLGWSPKTTLSEGLTLMLAHYVDHAERPTPLKNTDEGIVSPLENRAVQKDGAASLFESKITL